MASHLQRGFCDTPHLSDSVTYKSHSNPKPTHPLWLKKLTEAQTVTVQRRWRGVWPAQQLRKVQSLGPRYQGKTPGPSPIQFSGTTQPRGKPPAGRLLQHPPPALIRPWNLQVHSLRNPPISWDLSSSLRYRKELHRADQVQLPDTDSNCKGPRKHPWDRDTDCKNWIKRQRYCLHQLEEKIDRHQSKNATT